MSDRVDQLLRRAFQARRENRGADAERDLVEAVELSRTAGGVGVLARALTGLGQIERDLHRTEAAIQHYIEASAIYRAEGDARSLAHTIRHVGDIHRHAGRMELAEPCYHEALDIYRNDPETPSLDLANAVRGLALLKQELGHNEEARRLWQEAKDLYAAVNVQAGVAESSRRLLDL